MVKIRNVGCMMVIGSLVSMLNMQAMDQKLRVSREKLRKTSAPAQMTPNQQNAASAIAPVKLSRLQSLQLISSGEIKKNKLGEIERKQREHQLKALARSIGNSSGSSEHVPKEMDSQELKELQEEVALRNQQELEDFLASEYDVDGNDAVEGADDLVQQAFGFRSAPLPGFIELPEYDEVASLKTQKQSLLEQLQKVCLALQEKEPSQAEVPQESSLYAEVEDLKGKTIFEMLAHLSRPLPGLIELPGYDESTLLTQKESKEFQQEVGDLLAHWPEPLPDFRKLPVDEVVSLKEQEQILLVELRNVRLALQEKAPKHELYTLIKSGNLASVQLALDSGMNANIQDGQGNTPLHWALDPEIAMSCDDRLALLKLLIERGADVSALNNDGRTAMHQAALSGLPEAAGLIEYLLEQDILTELYDMEGKCPLHVAVERGRVDLVKLLAKNTLSIDQTDFKDRTALQLAFGSQLDSKTKKVIVSDLIQAGANPNVCDQEKTPLLFNVIKLVDLGGVELLLGLGADVKKTDLRNRTAVEYAQEKVATSANPKAKDVLRVVKEYYEGARKPQVLAQKASRPVLSISLPEGLQDTVDIELFRAQISAMLTRPGAEGKTLLEIAVEKATIANTQAPQEIAASAEEN